MNDCNRSRCYDYMRNLIAEIKCARHDGFSDHAHRCECDLRRIWKVRHTVRVDRNGMPTDLVHTSNTN